MSFFFEKEGWDKTGDEWDRHWMGQRTFLGHMPEIIEAAK